MKLKFDTKNLSFKEIMAGGTLFDVPKFQRDYAWNQDQWEDLWSDLENTESDDQHYMGYLVLQERDANKSAVIDGQQRITTTTLLILAALHCIKEFADRGESVGENTKRLETLREQFIGYTDPVSLRVLPRLTLNRNNNTYFRNYLCTLDTNPPIRNTKQSEKLLSKAKDFFKRKIEERGFTTGEAVAEFIASVSGKLLFTLITVGGDLNAYKVFETLNARGVQLSIPDLTKNFLFSVIDSGEEMHETRIDELEDRWEHITSQLGKLDFTRFIHAEWNSRNAISSKNALFKTLKNRVSTPVVAFEYLRSLEKSAEVFAALHNGDDEFWNRDGYKGASQSLKTLSMFNILQPHGLLIAAYHKFTSERFIKILKAIETVTMRYNVIGSLPTNRQETVYNRIARKIASEEIINVSGVKNELRELYVDDDDFIASFKNKHMKTDHSDKKARYILARIEEQANGQDQCNDTVLTLEHILPQNPGDAWNGGWDHEKIDQYTNVIGNMTLLSKEQNQQVGNQSFDQKKQIFSKSHWAITRKVATYEHWVEDTLLEHLDWLSELAKRRWNIQFT